MLLSAHFMALLMFVCLLFHGSSLSFSHMAEECWWLWYCDHLDFDLCCVNVCGISRRYFSNGPFPIIAFISMLSSM